MLSRKAPFFSFRNLLILLVCIALPAFFACEPSVGGSSPGTFTVTFVSNWGSDVPSQQVKEGSKATEPTPPVKDDTTGYDGFDYWCSDVGLTTQFIFATTPITGDITLYAKWKLNASLVPGNQGPGDGEIFYKSAAGFLVWRTETQSHETCHYLEAATVDLGSLQMWYRPAYWPTDIVMIGITGTESAIGTGRLNTKIMSWVTEGSSPAAEACLEYEGNGVPNWFLPSKDELNELYKYCKNRTFVYMDAPQPDVYWTSTQFTLPEGELQPEHEDHWYAWAQALDTGTVFHELKSNENFVRPIRAF